jgi:elongation factor 1-alpha
LFLDEFEAGISKGGTTREEAIVAYTNGIKQFIVLVNKMDLVQYSEARFEEIKTNVTALLVKIGANKDLCPFIPASSWLGENLTSNSGTIYWSL